MLSEIIGDWSDVPQQNGDKVTFYHYVKKSVFGVILVRIFHAFSRIRSEYAEIRSISPYSVPMRENFGKNEDQNNSKYGHFLRSVPFCK